MPDPPAARRPAAAPSALTSQQVVALEDQGFPERLRDAFRHTAAELGCVVVSRSPGAAATQLIADAHDLKGFKIKAKSCDWGPMAGFVCQLPLLNKSGADPKALRGNAKAHAETEGYYRKTRAPTPWVELAISQASVDRLTALPQGRVTLGAESGRQRVGVASDAARTVLMEFVLQRRTPGASAPAPTTWWGVYHRRVFLRAPDDPEAPWRPYLTQAPAAGQALSLDPAPGSGFSVLGPSRVQAPAAALEDLVAKHAAACGLPVPPAGPVLPEAFAVRGTRNPYLPYANEDPRNAVAGDYDLFAVWPPEPAVTRTGRRVAELRVVDADRPQAPFFRRLDRMTAVVSRAPSVRIETVPRPAEITPLEDPGIGNVSELVQVAAQTLNSFSVVGLRAPTPGAGSRSSDETPNAAFHSDEGGRPDITTVDLPVVAFLPARGGRPAEVHIAQTHRAFVELLLAVRDEYRVSLHLVWLLHLADALVRPLKGVTPADVAATRAGLVALLTGRPVDRPGPAADAARAQLERLAAVHGAVVADAPEVSAEAMMTTLLAPA